MQKPTCTPLKSVNFDGQQPANFTDSISYTKLTFLHQRQPRLPKHLYLSNETPTWCKIVQVLFLQSYSTCFGRKRPCSGVFKTSTMATVTCVIVTGKSSHLLIRAGIECVLGRYSITSQHEFSSGPNKEIWWLTRNDNTCTSGRRTSFKYSWRWALAPETCRVTLQK